MILRIGVILGVLCCTAGAHAQAPTQPKHQQTVSAQSRSTINQKPTTTLVSPTPNQTPEQEQGTGADTEQRKYEAQQLRLNEVLTRYNGFLALFTFALVIVGGLQGWLLWSQYKTQKIALRANRPYLLPIKARLSALAEPITGAPLNEPVTVDRVKGMNVNGAAVEFRNVGSGPAIIDKVVGRLIQQSAPHAFPNPRQFNDCIEIFQRDADNNVLVRELLTKDESAEFEIDLDGPDGHDLSSDEIQMLKRDCFFIFYGCLYYRDVFDHELVTEFCYTLIPVFLNQRQLERGFGLPGVEFVCDAYREPRANNRCT